MSNISMVEAKLPPGFRFHPKDDELVCDYLMRKAAIPDHHPPDNINYALGLMIEVDLNKCEPWDIPETACVGSKEWYFYSQRDRKYATGLRTNRATATGYWKATGKDRAILRKGALVGMRKTLVFYQGRAPKGRKTDWVMHEFRIEGPSGPPKVSSSLKEDWVLCRVFFKNREVAASRLPNCFDRGTSLPPLMDSSSYITFDPTQQPGNDMNSEYDDNEQVPCFSNNDISIFSQVPNFPHGLAFLNNVPAVPTGTKSGSIDVNYNAAPSSSIISLVAAAPSYGSSSSSSSAALLTADLGSTCCFELDDSNNNNCYDNPPSNDKKVLKAVLKQLTKMEAATVKLDSHQSSSLSLGDHEGSSSAASECFNMSSEVGMATAAASATFWGGGHYY